MVVKRARAAVAQGNTKRAPQAITLTPSGTGMGARHTYTVTHTQPLVRKLDHIFSETESTCGFSDMGWIKDDCVTLEVELSADMPHGI